MTRECCPVCGYGVDAKPSEMLLHCPGCGKWWKKKGNEMPCKGKKKGRRGGKK